MTVRTAMMRKAPDERQVSSGNLPSSDCRSSVAAHGLKLATMNRKGGTCQRR